MTTYNTGNPVGSAAAKDLYDNAQVLDEYVNSDENTTDDRLGNSRLTLKGLESAATSAGPTIAAASEALAQANSARQSAEESEQHASDAKDAAESAAQDTIDGINSQLSEATAARDEAVAAAEKAQAIVDSERTFDTVAAGIAGTTDGQYFMVPATGSGGQTLFVYYKNNAGTAVEIGSVSASDAAEYQSATSVSSSADNTINITIPGVLRDGTMIYLLSPITNTGVTTINVTDLNGNNFSSDIYKGGEKKLSGGELVNETPTLIQYRDGSYNNFVVVTSGVLASDFKLSLGNEIKNLSTENRKIKRNLNFNKLVFSGDPTRENSFYLERKSLVDITAFTTSASMTALNMVSLSEDSNDSARFFFPGASSLTDGNLYSMYKPFRYSDLSFYSIAENNGTIIRVVYSLPDDFGGISPNLTTMLAFDITGVFYPMTAETISSSSVNAISGHSNKNFVQFVVPISDVEASGFTSDTIQKYIDNIASDCLFALYTGVWESNYVEDREIFRTMSPGYYSVSYTSTPGITCSVYQNVDYVNQYKGNYDRFVADVKNNASIDYKNYPVELKVKFPDGLLKSSDCLVLKDSDGNEIDCQFADEFHVNPRTQSNAGYSNDGSLICGSVFFSDSIAAGEAKYYELKAFSTEVKNNKPVAFGRSERDFFVDYDGYRFYFDASNHYQLSRIVDTGGISHAVSTHIYFAGKNSSSTILDAPFAGRPMARVVNSGPVFVDVETTVYNTAFNSVPADSLMARIRTRIFKNGKVQVWTMVTALKSIDKGILCGVASRLGIADGGFSFDNNALTCAWTDATDGRNWSCSVVRANGDVHRDGASYGPTRPIRAIFITPAAGSVRGYAGWQYTDSSDPSLVNWPVENGWVWTHEFWIDCNNSITDKVEIGSQIQNRPVGYLGKCSFPEVLKNEMLDFSLNHISGTMQWWNSAAAESYGGGTDKTKMYHSHTADLLSYVKYGVGSSDQIFLDFSAYVSRRWGSIATIGNAYKTGLLRLQFASRLAIPPMQWLHHVLSDEGKTDNLAVLNSGIKSLADAIVTVYNRNGGVPLDGSSTTDKGNSNSIATALRAIGLAIYAGLDSDGDYLAAFNSLESMLTSRSSYMRFDGIVTDASTEILPAAHYLHYQVYSANNYLFACDAAGKAPAFDLVNYIISATAGMGALRELDFCISESRRGSANTISFALFPLLFSSRASASNAASALLNNLKTEYGPKKGYPKRFFNFDGTTSGGDTLADISFVATTLADIYFFFYFKSR